MHSLDTWLPFNKKMATQEASVIQSIDHLLDKAHQARVSDIHIETLENESRIRVRRDGLLREVTQLPKEISKRFLTRLKVMAKLNVSEQRLPQDGHFRFRSTVDCRVSTCPTLFGEKMVVRLLNHEAHCLALQSLGLLPQQKTLLLEALQKSQGLILVTGPTGAGKSMTLYAALNEINSSEKNITTLEDPVEVQIVGVNQINIAPKIGLGFAPLLRTVLRQDPDILMVGEIRDQETADIALKAAQTGHLVLSTLHTNDAISSMVRLLQMGMPACHIASALSLIVAQRLIRKCCPLCQGNACDQCDRGYEGRTGFFELLPITDCLRSALYQTTTSAHLKKQAEEEGFESFFQIAQTLIAQGVTNMKEIKRVLC